MCSREHALNVHFHMFTAVHTHTNVRAHTPKKNLIILVQIKCFSLPNMILVIYKLQIDHDLFNATKSKQIIILNIHAPLLILQLKSRTIISNHGLFGTLPGESN